MFHYVTGVPFESETHGGAYDDLTMWEQIDEGAQYTPAKKWLVCTPIVLFVDHAFPVPLTLVYLHDRFLVSTHYTNYHPWAFAINFSALVFVLLAKLPQVRSLWAFCNYLNDESNSRRFISVSSTTIAIHATTRVWVSHTCYSLPAFFTREQAINP